MKNEVKDFKRKELFDMYHERSNPFLFVTTKIDITNIVNYCKKHKNYYATIGYFILLAANELDCFKYRLENNKIYKYDDLRVNFVQMIDDDEIGFFGWDNKSSYKDFIKEFEQNQDKFFKEKILYDSIDEGEVWFSCTPWFEFSSLVVPFDKNITVPQFIWSKFIEENDKVYTNLMIMVHHGFADGNHVGKFLKLLNEKIDNLDAIVGKEVH